MNNDFARHLTALLAKYVGISIALGVTLALFTDVTFAQVLWIAAVLSIVAYIIGDLLVLPATSNGIATLVDAATAWVILMMMAPTQARGGALLASLIAVAVVEYMFHTYLQARTPAESSQAQQEEE